MTRAVSVVALALPLLFLTVEAQAQGYAVETTASNLNVRDSAWGSVVGTARQGMRFVVGAQDGDWLRIDFQGRQAWVSASYTRRVASDGAAVTATFLNVRSGPSTSNKVIGLVARGQRYARLAASGDWFKIQYDDRTGWVSAAYVDRVSYAGAAASAPNASSRPAIQPGERRAPAMQATQAELEVLARICKGEAGVCSYQGKVAVCAVVLNRVRASGFPNTITGVAHQPYQFSCYDPPRRNQLYWGSIPQDCWNAAREALAGRDPSLGATFYFNPYLVRPSWARSMHLLVRIGSGPSDTHDFYRP